MPTTTDTAAATFQVGGTYTARSASNSDCVWTFTVTKRTAKFVTLVEDSGETMRVGVTVWNGEETAKPFGTYSMCAVIFAGRQA